MSFELRPYQATAVRGCRNAMVAGFKRIILSSPTGSGKTEIGFEIMRGAQAKGKKVAFLANRIHLVDQTCRRLREAGFEYGVIQGENTSAPWRSVLVCSVQTVAKRGLPDVDLIVIDEAHSAAGTAHYREIMAGKPVIGLTATPYSKGLGKFYPELGGALFEIVVTAARIEDLIRDGYLVSADVWAPGEPDLSGVRTTAGDYNEKDLGEAVDKTELIGDIVSHWFKIANNTPTVCFATNIAHSKHIVEQFRAAGVIAEHIDCYTKDEERQAILRRVASRETMVISNVGILAEGWDFPACKTLILARPTKSLIRYLQMAGRVLRPYPGKEVACLVKGAQVLTDCGLISIDKISIDHKIWDGTTFVSHGGAIYQGIKDVISYAGITGTPDHLIQTDQGWQTIAEARRRRLRVAKSGSGGDPIRFFDDCFSKNEWIDMESSGPCTVREVQSGPYEQIPQHQKTTEYGGLSSLQPTVACEYPSLDLYASTGARTAVQQPQECGISELRGQGDSVQIRRGKSSGSLDCREFGDTRGSNPTSGSDRQRRPLRGWESKMVNREPEHGPYTEEKFNCSVASVPSTISRSEVCGCNPEKHAGDGPNLRANSGEVQSSIMQAQGEVWDILDCGPLHRFTANGALVHNCILDHSGVVRRLGFPWDYFGQHLDDGKPKQASERKEKDEEALPKACPQCHYMKPPKTPKCPSCGFEARRPCQVETVDGELVPLTKKTKKGIKGLEEIGRTHVYHQMLWIARERGYKDGWAAMKYCDAFGTWPNGISKEPEVADGIVLSWVHSQQIKWAKGRGRVTA